MAKFVKGEVVVVPFPFSDLSQAKRRPALVMATLTGDDLILCQITSQTIKDACSSSERFGFFRRRIEAAQQYQTESPVHRG